jgi:hypothetical protein
LKKDSKKLLNYTTEIAPAKTAGEIVGILAAKGAKSVNMDYANGEPVALWFKIEVNGQDISFRLPCNVEGAERALRRTAPPRYQNKEQAKRTAWRIVKDWVEAQMAVIECEQIELGEAFLPYAVMDDGRTMYEVFKVHTQKMLATVERKQLSDGNVAEFRAKSN